MEYKEYYIDIAQQRFALKHWCPGREELQSDVNSCTRLPVLALHGWLDNAASFDFIAPLMPNLELICVDLVGHGRSSHRKDLASYTLWRDVIELVSLVDHLGWQHFALLGHSRGAIIAMMMAATLPERVSHLGLIESIFPLTNTAEQGPDQLREAIKFLQTRQDLSPTLYSDFDDAVAARVKGLFQVSPVDARALAARSVVQTDNGSYWNNDFKLKVPSEIRLSKAQADVYLSRLSMPAHVIFAESGFFVDKPEFDQWLGDYPNIINTWLPGGHHLHMSENAQLVAEVLNAFYS